MMDKLIQGTLVGGVFSGLLSIIMYGTQDDDRWFLRLFCLFVCLGFLGVLRKLDQLIEK